MQKFRDIGITRYVRLTKITQVYKLFGTYIQ